MTAGDPIDPAEVRRYQERLLEETREFFEVRGRRLSESTRRAFFAAPRHRFIERYKVSPDAPWRHFHPDDLPLIYRDEGFGIFDEGEFVATISRPAMVLYMLDLLRLEPGLRVFEVGAGSGWNAALLGECVGPAGSVESVEIIPELVERAKDIVPAQVHIRLADGGDEKDAAPEQFDRLVFTTGAYDLPASIAARVKNGGYLLMVLKIPGAGDLLVRFRRDGEVFRAEESMRCEFVPMTGKGGRAEHDAIEAGAVLRSTEAVAERALHLNDELRSYLVASAPELRAVQGRGYVLSTPDGQVHLTGERAIAYGSRGALEALDARLKEWVELGMPAMWTMGLEARPRGRPSEAGSKPGREFIMRRRDTDFVWTIPD